MGALLAHVTPALAAAGDLERVTARLDHLLAQGSGADVQRRWREAGADDGDAARPAADRTLA